MANINSFKELAVATYRDIRKLKGEVHETELHLEKAIDWLCLAQDSTKDGGVSEGYHLYHGWLPSYPETTGYIIETVFDYARIKHDEALFQRAVRMADWLVSIQNPDGSIPDSYFRNKMVFDTGMVIFGLVRTFQETGGEQYKVSAVNAANWLINQQEEDGSWIINAADGIPHTYYSRVAWSLLTVFDLTDDETYRNASMSNIEWCLKQQKNNGWFDKSSFNLSNHNRPFTHTIAYTLRGILESGLYLDNELYIASVRKAVDNLLNILPGDKYVCGEFDPEWVGNDHYSCLTGNAQLAIILCKLFARTSVSRYIDNAIAINETLKQKQQVTSSNKNIVGAIAGSFPIWGRYIHYCYPNWATKFFAESLMCEYMTSKK